MSVMLRIEKSSDENWKFENEFDQEIITIGRDKSNDIHLEDTKKMVSRHHAQLKRDDGGFVLIDCESVNATYLNGKKIEPNKAYHLSTGDQFKVGLYMIDYEWVEQQTNDDTDSDHTLVLVNPFEDVFKALKSSLGELASQFESEDEFIRKSALQRGMSELIGSVENTDVLSAMSDNFSDGPAEVLSSNGAVAPSAPVPQNEAMDAIIDALLTVVNNAWNFRSTFIGITSVATESSLHKMSREELKTFLTDSSISAAERKQRFSEIKAQIDDLLLHQKAMSEAYRATVEEGQQKIAQTLDPRQIESHFARMKVGFGPFKIPAGWIPFYVQSRVNAALKQMISDILSESAGTLDRNVFRSVFVNAYMQRLTSNESQVYDSQRFWKLEES